MSTPYGMPPTPPTGAPPLPPAKSRTPLYIGLTCGCVLLLLLVLGGAGLGFYLLGQDGGEEPTSPPSSIVDPPPSEDPSDDPTDDPSSPTSEAPTEIETDQPVDKPTEGPSADATSPSDEIFTLTVSKPEEGTTLELGGETKTPENDKFIGVAVTIEQQLHVHRARHRPLPPLRRLRHGDQHPLRRLLDLRPGDPCRRGGRGAAVRRRPRGHGARGDQLHR